MLGNDIWVDVKLILPPSLNIIFTLILIICLIKKLILYLFFITLIFNKINSQN
jgi:hypothetical protein